MESYLIYPTKKHNRPAPPTKIYLHALDLMGPIDIRNNRIFHRPSSNIAFKDIVEKLKSSLAEALELYPPAAGLVKPDENGKVYIAIDPQNFSGTPFLVDVKATPFVTESAHLSPRTGILPPETSTLAVKVTQFSCGSIAVATSIHHQVTDLRGFLDLLEVWAQLNRGEQIDYTKIPDDFTRTPNRFFSGLMEKARAGPTTIAPPGFVLHDKPPTNPLTYLQTPSEITNWVMTQTAVEQLKAHVSPTKEDQWISSGDAVAALLWGAITRARSKAQVARMNPDSPIETILCAADGRERDPHGKMPKGKYFGNFNPLFSCTAPHLDLLEEGSEGGAITRVALQIRTAVKEQLSPEALAAKLAFFENPQNLEPGGRIALGVADFIMTNWCHIDLKGPKLDFGWGEAFYASPGLCTGYVAGCALLTQDKTTGVIQILLTVEAPAADNLKNDTVMNKYATLIKT